MIGIGLLALGAATFGVNAQGGGCQASNLSCSQFHQRCAQTCSTGQRPAQCVAQACDPELPRCQQSGEWRSRSSATACWRTNNRS